MPTPQGPGGTKCSIKPATNPAELWRQGSSRHPPPAAALPPATSKNAAATEKGSQKSGTGTSGLTDPRQTPRFTDGMKTQHGQEKTWSQASRRTADSGVSERIPMHDLFLPSCQPCQKTVVVPTSSFWK